MIEKKEDIEVIFIVSHLRDNTTSAERYKSFIREFLLRRVRIKIIEFKYPYTKNVGKAHQVENSDVLDSEISDKIITLDPKLDLFQRLFFTFLKRGVKTPAKAINFIYQLLNHHDVYYPGNVMIENSSNGKDGFVIASGGPFGAFIYAEKLAKNLNYKLVLDYRDPWNFGYKSLESNSLIYKIKKAITIKTEFNLLKKADLVTTVSNTLKSYYPLELQNKIFSVPNGGNFDGLNLFESNYESFNIVYCGTIYDEQLISNVFFESIQKWLLNKDTKSIKLQFLGSHLSDALKEKLSEYNLNNISEITKRLKKEELTSYLSKAALFLHLKYGNKTGIITSKQADYLALRRPILLPVSDNGDIEESITANNAGYVCNTVGENVAILEMLYKKFLNKESLIIPQSEEMINNNSRGYIAKDFVDLVLKS